MNEIELKINKLAQGMISLEDGLEWFDESSAKDKNNIMGTLDLCIFQSHPTAEDIEIGIASSKLKETYSPCVLVRKKHLNEVRAKVRNMTGIDQRRGFILFLSIFSIADARRRETQCINGCTHDWHNLES